ncbi:Cullin family protein, partial [Globisporangium splendens]
MAPLSILHSRDQDEATARRKGNEREARCRCSRAPRFAQWVDDCVFYSQKLQRTEGEVEFLREYCTSFESYTTGTGYISELFRYLVGFAPFTELALHIWDDIAFAKLKKRIVNSIVEIYEAARRERSEVFDNGEYIAKTVEHTLRYYGALGKELITKLSVAEYLREVELLCSQEQRRCEGRMHRITVADIRQKCCEVLVETHTERICGDAETFLVSNQTDDLHRLFMLFSELAKEKALVSFKNILQKYIEQRGLDVVRKFRHDDASKNPESYIEALVQACRAFANSHPKLPELLAKYTHCLMSHDKKSGAHHQLHPSASGIPSTSLLSEETLEKKIENVGVVFCLIDDKDVFKKYYAKFLAKRLIKGTSIAGDLEVLLIQKLRDICGHDFVSKLQKMLKDKMLSKVGTLCCNFSRELLDSFSAWMEEKDIELRREGEKHALAIRFHLSMSYHCDILTAGAWPISSTIVESNLSLPPEVEAHIALFTKFYTGRSSGRKLLWTHHLSFGTLQANCFDKRYEFALSFYQMMILLQAKMLLSTGDEENPTYSLNFGFSSRKIRVSAVPSSPVESPKVVRATNREVEEDRKMALQASIVRVLKTRRDVLQSQLEVDVIDMLRNQFAPTSAAIKQNVAILIEKEYLRRHESNEHRLLYVA